MKIICHEDGNIIGCMNQQFMPVKGFEKDYIVSRSGNVYKRITCRKVNGFKILPKNCVFVISETGEIYQKLNAFSNTGDYLTVHLKSGKETAWRLLHRIVAEAFIPNPENLETVNHKDENKRNNKVSNLEWMTRANNVVYSIGKKVNQFDEKGVFVRCFNSVKECAEIVNIKDYGNFRKALMKRKVVYRQGFYFSFLKDELTAEDFTPEVQKYFCNNCVKIVKKDLNDNVLKVYNSIHEAAKDNPFGRNPIRKALDSKSHITHGSKFVKA